MFYSLLKVILNRACFTFDNINGKDIDSLSFIVFLDSLHSFLHKTTGRHLQLCEIILFVILHFDDTVYFQTFPSTMIRRFSK